MIMVFFLFCRIFISVRYICIVRRIFEDMNINIKISVLRFLFLVILFFLILGKNLDFYFLYFRYGKLL